MGYLDNNGLSRVWGKIKQYVSGASVSYAEKAGKLGADDKGNSNKGIYLESGIVKIMSYELNKTVPSDAVFTDTHYSAGTGLALNGTTFNHSNSVTATSTQTLNKFTYDAQGHITGSTAATKNDIVGMGIQSAITSSTPLDASGGLVSFTRKDWQTTSPIGLIDNGTLAPKNVIVSATGSNVETMVNNIPATESGGKDYLMNARTNLFFFPKINGNRQYNTDSNFYAPTSAGTKGYVLESNGSGAPVWVAKSSSGIYVHNIEIIKNSYTVSGVNRDTQGNFYISLQLLTKSGTALNSLALISAALKDTTTVYQASGRAFIMGADCVVEGIRKSTTSSLIVVRCISVNTTSGVGLTEITLTTTEKASYTPDTITDSVVTL